MIEKFFTSFHTKSVYTQKHEIIYYFLLLVSCEVRVHFYSVTRQFFALFTWNQRVFLSMTQWNNQRKIFNIIGLVIPAIIIFSTSVAQCKIRGLCHKGMHAVKKIGYIPTLQKIGLELYVVIFCQFWKKNCSTHVINTGPLWSDDKIISFFKTDPNPDNWKNTKFRQSK